MVQGRPAGRQYAPVDAANQNILTFLSQPYRISNCLRETLPSEGGSCEKIM
jgi:hypothetical protein